MAKKCHIHCRPTHVCSLHRRKWIISQQILGNTLNGYRYKIILGNPGVMHSVSLGNSGVMHSLSIGNPGVMHSVSLGNPGVMHSVSIQPAHPASSVTQV